MIIEERASTHVYRQKRMFTKEELEATEHLCVHEQPPYDMGKVCHIARENMVSTGKMPLAPHEFALMDMVFSNDEAFLCRP